MNKETKIGLVTGVTLIVLIGAMLSSYLSAPRDRIGDLALAGQGRNLRNQISNPVGIAQVPIPQNATMNPVQLTPQAMAPVSTRYNQVTQLPYGSATAPTTSAESLTPAAAMVTPRAVPVVAAQKPVPSVAVVAATVPTSARTATYIVRPGDTLGKIAWHFYHDSGPVAVRRIVHANASKLSSAAATIRVGEALTIPPAAQQAGTSHVHLLTMAAQSTGNSYGTKYSTQRVAPASDGSVHTYRVESGDTLWGIARKTMGAGTEANVHRIMVLNHIRDARTIAVGQVLKIPS